MLCPRWNRRFISCVTYRLVGTITEVLTPQPVQQNDELSRRASVLDAAYVRALGVHSLYLTDQIHFQGGNLRAGVGGGLGNCWRLLDGRKLVPLVDFSPCLDK